MMRVTTLVPAGVLVLAACAARPVDVSIPTDPVLAPGPVDRACSDYDPLFTELLRSHQCSALPLAAADLDGDGDPELLLAIRTTPLASAMGRPHLEHLLVTRRADGQHEQRLRLEDDPNLGGEITATPGVPEKIEITANVTALHCTVTRKAHLELTAAVARLVWDQPPHCEPEHYTEVLTIPAP